MHCPHLPPGLVIRIVNWTNNQTPLSSIRKTVFIVEQNVPEALEWDGLDQSALHILAQIRQNNHVLPVGTARIIINKTTAHIGRMAVLKPWRHQGIGQQILHRAIAECRKQGVQKIILNAQTYVLNFYQQAGFQISSDEFMDAGIAHRKMTLFLNNK